MKRVKLAEIHYDSEWNEDLYKTFYTEVSRSTSEWQDIKDEEYDLLRIWVNQSNLHTFKRIIVEDRTLYIEEILKEVEEINKKLKEKELEILKRSQEREKKRKANESFLAEKKKQKAIEKAKKTLEKFGAT